MIMAIELSDDGTMDTVLRCSECGEEMRYMYDSADDDGKDEADINGYDAFVEWAIEDATSEHECQAVGGGAFADDDSTELEESDITTKDHANFYQDGKLVLFRMANGRTWRYWAGSDKGERPLGSFDTCEAALRAYMDRVQFWPNAWFISDHGNAHLMDLGDSK